MQNKLITVITPTYNRASFLKHTLQSVVNQTYPYWEVIVIDDGSTDGTEAMIECIGDTRIRYFYQKNQGASVARNNAFAHSRGEWITYLDSDDLFDPEYMQVIMESLRAHPEAIFAYPMGRQYLELYEDNILVERIDRTESEFHGGITVADIVNRKFRADIDGFIHSRRVIENGIRFDTSMKNLEDWEFIITICEKYPDEFLFVNKVLYTYSQRYGGDGVVSNTSYQEMANAFEYIYQKHKDDAFMRNQTWYPNRVNKWRNCAALHTNGDIPPMKYYYFPERWDTQQKNTT